MIYIFFSMWVYVVCLCRSLRTASHIDRAGGRGVALNRLSVRNAQQAVASLSAWLSLDPAFTPPGRRGAEPPHMPAAGTLPAATTLTVTAAAAMARTTTRGEGKHWHEEDVPVVGASMSSVHSSWNNKIIISLLTYYLLCVSVTFTTTLLRVCPAFNCV